MMCFPSNEIGHSFQLWTTAGAEYSNWYPRNLDTGTQPHQGNAEGKGRDKAKRRYDFSDFLPFALNPKHFRNIKAVRVQIKSQQGKNEAFGDHSQVAVCLYQGAEEAMKKKASKRSEHTEPLTTKQLCDIWEKILSDSDGRRALKRLDEAGFRISHLTPSDATFERPCWADYVAAIPLLPNRPSTRRIHRKIKLRKYWPLVLELRQFAANVASPFTVVTVLGARGCLDSDKSLSRDDLLKAATVVEHFLSWDYCVRNLNPRHAVIAELRWTIREKTGRPHDNELNALMDSAFRAAGSKEDCYIDSTTLERVEKRQRESRVKAHQRIRRLLSTSPPSSRH
jgi:hypothetical protein